MNTIAITLVNGIDGALFAKQRALVLELAISDLLAPAQRELLEGLSNMLDLVADQAHAQGVDCLMRPEHHPGGLLAAKGSDVAGTSDTAEIRR